MAGQPITHIAGRPAANLAQPAAPTDPGAAVPDAGSRPTVGGSFQLPGTVGLPGTGEVPGVAPVPGVQPGTGGLPAGTIPAVQPGPLGQRIMTESASVEALGQQLLKLGADVTEAQRTADTAHQVWTQAAAELSDLRTRADQEAGEAYKAAAALGPLSQYTSDLHDWSVLAPSIGQQPGGEATARAVERAERDERSTFAGYQAATARVETTTRLRDTTKTDFDKRSVALADLRNQNAVAYQRELAAIDAQQAAIGAGLNVGGAVDGLTAGPIAQKAIAAAKTKLGRPYVWGDEGPESFDCSGLVLWSYQQAHYNLLPRVANDQYNSTRARAVRVDKLLPGDLLFFATDKADWRSIHHVAMYYGNGYMIQAPSTGDVVKISPIWWSEFYGATRVADPVPVTPPPAQPVTPPVTPPSTPPSKPPSGPPSTPPSAPPSGPPSSPPSSPPSTPPSVPPSSPPSKPPTSGPPPSTPPRSDPPPSKPPSSSPPPSATPSPKPSAGAAPPSAPAPSVAPSASPNGVK
jgi:cell wall-associated NlpC family hydrolase